MYYHISEADKEAPLTPGLLMAVACQNLTERKRTQKIKRPEIKSREELGDSLARVIGPQAKWETKSKAEDQKNFGHYYLL